MQRLISAARLLLCLSVLLLIGGTIALLWRLRSGSAHPGVQAMGILACLCGTLGVLLWSLVLWMYVGLAQRAEDLMKASQCLAHWTCSAAEWDRFRIASRLRARRILRAVMLTIGVAAMLVTVGIVMGLRGEKTTLDKSIVLRVIGTIGAGWAALYLILFLLVVFMPRRTSSAPANLQVYIGADGFIAGGRFVCWPALRAQFQSVQYEPGDPGVLRFKWVEPGARTDGVRVPVDALVPVPKANDADAAGIVGFFLNRSKSE